MNVGAAQFLLSPQGKEVLSSVGDVGSEPLKVGAALRKAFPGITPAYLSAAAEVCYCRIRATGKFERADEMFFTRDTLEQATGEDVAAHCAERFRGSGRVWDLCCGIGGDAIALARTAYETVCVDSNPLHLAFCEENLRVHGQTARMIEQDVCSLVGEIPAGDRVYIDPSRRSDGRRTTDLNAMSPPLTCVERLLSGVRGGGVKLSPASDLSAVSLPCEIEWISAADGLREVVVWTGDVRRCETTVTLLHRGVRLCDTDLPDGEPVVGEIGSILYEPDSALIRSGLLGRKAVSLGMRLVSRGIAYMTADTVVRDEFFTAWRIVHSMPFSMKRLRAWLLDRDIGAVTVKKRGFPLSPEEVSSALKLSGTRRATIVLTRIGVKHAAMVVEPLSDGR